MIIVVVCDTYHITTTASAPPDLCSGSKWEQARHREVLIVDHWQIKRCIDTVTAQGSLAVMLFYCHGTGTSVAKDTKPVNELLPVTSALAFSCSGTIIVPVQHLPVVLASPRECPRVPEPSRVGSICLLLSHTT